MVPVPAPEVAKSKNKKAKKAKTGPPKSSFLSLEDQAEDGKRVQKRSDPFPRGRGIVYFSHLPHGFYEKELRQFLGQFGSVTNLRLGRSKRTGGSKGFAFVEFR